MADRSTAIRGELEVDPARYCSVVHLFYAVRVRPLNTLLVALLPLLSAGQSAWPVDSLLSSWPARLAVAEARHQNTPGVIRAVHARALTASAQRSAPAIPLFADSNVVRWVDLYGEPKREDFRVLLGAAQQQFPLIEAELARQGLPAELKYLPMAMSGMNLLAASQQGEAGPWMLTYPVALRYGLVVTADQDQRHDPRLSTMAAVRYYKDLFARYQDHGLAIAAFACGPANLERAQGRTGGSRSLVTLYPHFTSGHQHVLPFLMACIHLATNANELGMAAIPFPGPEAVDTLRSPTELRVSALVAALGIDRARLRHLNPVLCGDRIPAYERYLLPRGEAARYQLLADSVQRLQQQALTTAGNNADPRTVRADGREALQYRVRAGDSLGQIAMRFGVKVSQIKAWNKLRSDRIGIGDRLLIYVPASQRARYDRVHDRSGGNHDSQPLATPSGSAAGNGAETPDYTWYTVRSGDSLYAIARRYPGVAPERIMQFNGISADIKPGQRIKIPRP